MSEDRGGSVITFYSYKGGTGRSMALANVAWILAANGNRVLIADWDLESPGLHRFFKPFLREEDLRGTGGVIDLIREYEDANLPEAPAERPDNWFEEFAKVRYPYTIGWDFPGGGSLDFLSAGRQNDHYAVTVGALDWENFYNRLHGARFFDALRADMKRRWDFTLVDSRTGLSDVADICTLHLPDVLVDCFTLSDQGIEGAARVAHNTRKLRAKMKRQPRILPVPMRVDQAEKEKAEAGRALAVRFFQDLPTGMTESERRRYWSEVEVPYRAFYAYEETLAVFGDPPGSRTSLLAAYETLTSYITDGKYTSLPVMDEGLRIREKGRYERRYPELPDDQIVLRYSAEDQVWAEWIERQLIAADVQVVGSQPGTDQAEGRRPVTPRTLTIISHSYLAADPGSMPPLETPGSGAPLAVYVSDVRPLPEFPTEKSITVVNQSASVAVDRILRLIDRQPSATQTVNGQSGPRFPGLEPRVFGAPARNARFTGREGELTSLREQLLSGGQAVVLQQPRNQPTALPVALQGMGGVGKTQLAIEYVHRFRTAYDVVWWVAADPPEFVDAALADMAPQVGVSAEVTDTAADTARAVLQKLRSGEAGRRWLIVFDNAEAVERISPFIPPVPQDGSGHVIVTSRNVAWSESTNPIPIDVFRRNESIAHLRQRVDTVTEQEANSIAEVLGDLPIAVAVAGAWLAETGATPAEYLHEVERHGSLALSAQRTWDLSLDRLKQQSPAAYRLLQFCSVFAPEIALDLLTSDRMAEALAPIDPSVSERVMRGAPIQQMSRLALIKLDPHAGQVQMHRVLQAVVRDRMTDEELEAARSQVQLVLAGSRPSVDVDDRRTWPQYRRLWPHLDASGAVRSDEPQVRQLLIDRVRFLWLGGDLEQGEQVARQTMEAWQEMLVEQPSSSLARQLLHLRFNLGNILRALGRFTDSRDLNEEVLREQQALLGDEHPHTLMTAGSLAADLRALGRYSEALPRDATTMQAWHKVLGEDHPRTLTAASNLAVSHRALGDFRAARALDEQVYERRRQVLGRDHQDTLLSASSLGRDMREAGEYERSVIFLQRVLQSYLEGYGPDDRGSLNAQANLAVSLRSAGRANEASQHLEDAYRRLNDRFGPVSPDTLACRLSRSANFLVSGERDKGSVELESVEEAYRSRLGERHPHWMVCLNNLCVAARIAGNHERALEWAVLATAEFERSLGDRHPYTLAAAVNLAGCLMEAGDPAAAHDRMRQVADLMAQTLGPNHPDTLACRTNASIAKRILDGLELDGTLPDPGLQLVETIGAEHPTVQELRQGMLSRRILDPHPY
jgi:tetratricopeptide (TPR) repeat protein